MRAPLHLLAALYLLAASAARAQFTFTNVADTTSPTHSFFYVPSINTTGTLGFYTNLDAGGSGLFTGNGTTTTTMALSSGPIYASLIGNPTINAVGTVGFWTNLDAGGTGLFTSDGTTTTTIGLSSDPTYSGFGGVTSLNTAGTLAFRGVLDGGPQGLFLSDGTTTTEVIREGDPLFGSTVTGFEIGRQALNDAGQLGFLYFLDDGRNGIAFATPVPEPGSALLLGIGVLGLLPRRRRSDASA